MKKIEAIIDAEHIDKVKNALELIGVSNFLVTEVRGFIRRAIRPAKVEVSNEAIVSFVPKCKLDISVADERFQHVARAIFNTSNSRAIIDGKLFFDSVDAESLPQ